MKLHIAAIVGLLGAGTAAVATVCALKPGMLRGGGVASTDNAYVKGDITPISPKVAGYVVEVAARDNAHVRAGQTLFRIDDADYRAKVDQAVAALSGRQAALANLDERMRLQHAFIRQAAAGVEAARADSQRARRDVVRARALADTRLISLSMLDAAEANDGHSAATVSETLANMAAARQQLAVLESQRPQLEADIGSAQAAVQLARIDLHNTIVTAPAEGWIGEAQTHKGQYVKIGTQMTALVPTKLWVVANFKETELHTVEAGQAARILVDAVHDAVFLGRVESLSPASGAQFALLPPDNATGNFTRIAQRIPVRIALDPGQHGLNRIRPGMSAVVEISADAGRHRSPLPPAQRTTARE